MDERDRLTEIDRSLVVRTFTTLPEGWEMDDTWWITANGAAYTRSHGGPPIRLTDRELGEHIRETTESLEGLLLARALRSHHRRVRHANDTAAP